MMDETFLHTKSVTVQWQVYNERANVRTARQGCAQMRKRAILWPMPKDPSLLLLEGASRAAIGLLYSDNIAT